MFYLIMVLLFMSFHLQKVTLLRNKLAPMCSLVIINSRISIKFKCMCSHPTVLLQKLKLFNEGDVHEVEKINN